MLSLQWREQEKLTLDFKVPKFTEPSVNILIEVTERT